MITVLKGEVINSKKNCVVSSEITVLKGEVINSQKICAVISEITVLKGEVINSKKNGAVSSEQKSRRTSMARTAMTRLPRLF